MYRTAIYPLSADPITKGHLNIIERILDLFDRVIVGIGINPDKKYTFTLSEREALAQKVLQRYGDRVMVKSFPGLLSDFAYENGNFTIIRGARNSTDFDFERLLNDINQSFRQGIETLIYIADQKLSHVSSSAAKELARNQAKNMLEYVPLVVKKALERKICGQYIIGITGEIACGKSYVAECLERYYKDNIFTAPYGSKITNIDLDRIGHDILETATERIYADTRKQLADIFGRELRDENGMIKTSELSKIIFDNPNSMSTFNQIMREPMSLLLRRKLLDTKGIIFINSALIAEENIANIVNNDIVVVKCSKETQVKRMRARGYSDKVIELRLAAQMTADKKMELLRANVSEQGYGHIIPFVNDADYSPKAIEALYRSIEREILGNDD